MRVSVGVEFEFTEPGTPCKDCGTPIENCLVLRLRAGSSTDQEGPYCASCLMVKTHLFVLEPPEEQVRVPHGGIKKRSKVQEQKIAEDLGGRAQPNSGAMAHAKGDVRKKGGFRVEAKYTAAKSYILHHEDLDKIRSEALYPEKPAFVVAFVNQRGGNEDPWAIIPYDDWLEYVNASSDDRRSPQRRRG